MDCLYRYQMDCLYWLSNGLFLPVIPFGISETGFHHASSCDWDYLFVNSNLNHPFLLSTSEPGFIWGCFKPLIPYSFDVTSSEIKIKLGCLHQSSLLFPVKLVYSLPGIIMVVCLSFSLINLPVFCSSISASTDFLARGFVVSLKFTAFITNLQS